jgi:anaerobic selenocysteine-containing dehydrogenase
VEAPGECRNNHEVICELAKRVGAEHPGFNMSPRELIDATLLASKRPGLERLEQASWIDVQPPFERAHNLDRFGHADGKFRFRPKWRSLRYKGMALGPVNRMPEFPDHWEAIEEATPAYPFRLATSPARTFLNSTFNETPSSRKREGRPSVMMHPDDLAELGIADGARVRLGSARGQVVLHVKAHAGQRRGVLIAEGIWPNDAHEDGSGINTLTGCDQPAPAGGGCFHDNRVWVRPA